MDKLTSWLINQAGIGIGFGLQQPLVVVQTVLSLSEVSAGTALMYFLQVLGGSVFVSVAQNLFANKLETDLRQGVPGLDPEIVLQTGATSIQQTIAPEYLPQVTLAYNNAIMRAFLVATVMACLTIIGSLSMEWENIKAKKGKGQDAVENTEQTASDNVPERLPEVVEKD